MDVNARLMRNKMWPHYDDWKEIFGKDRATGNNAEDVVEAWNDLREEDHSRPEHFTAPDDEFSYENDINEDNGDRESQSAKNEVQPNNKAKKRKVHDPLQGVCELLSEMNRSQNVRLEHLANRIGYEFDMGKARQETLKQLKEIPGLSRENRYTVLELVAFKAERLEIWKSMDNEARADYVDHLLSNRCG